MKKASTQDDEMRAQYPRADLGFMLLGPHEMLQNHPIGIEGVKVQKRSCQDGGRDGHRSPTKARATTLTPR